MDVSVNIKLIKSEDGRQPDMPRYATGGSAAIDLTAFIHSPVTINPQCSALIPTGIAIELPSSGYAAFLFARSGLSVKHGICLSNGVGVIDSDYRGEIKVGLINLGPQPYEIKPGDRIAQLAVMPVFNMVLNEVEDLGGSARSGGGFGSTGR